MILFSYFKTSARVLMKHRMTSILNISGLAIGMASCLLIYMYVQNELSYDQHHSNKDRIFRISSDINLTGQLDRAGMSSYMLSPTLKADYPEVEEAIRVMPIYKQTMWVEEKPFEYEDNLMSDQAFFKLFDYQFLDGDPATALKEPRSIVITDEVARQMFGTTSGLVGKSIRFSRQSYNITAVVKDIKNNSHLYFNTLISLNSLHPQMEATLKFDWFYLAQANYVMFRTAEAAQGFEDKLKQLRDKYIVPWLQQVNAKGEITFHLQPLSKIHLYSDFGSEYAKLGNRSYIYIFSIVAIFILLIACFNYINLATASATRRSKEISIRKMAGADFSSLFLQFISESILTAGLATLLALLLAELLLPAFNHLADKSLHMPFSFKEISGMLCISILVGLLAGIYPATLLARMQAIEVLRSYRMPGHSSAILRKILVFAQFAISTALLLCCIVVYAQMYYMKNKDLGFNKENILAIAVPAADSSFMSKYEVLKQQFLQNPSIVSMSGGNQLPGRQAGKIIQFVEQEGGKVEERLMDIMILEHSCTDFLGLPILKGRAFSKEIASDDTGAFIVNEAAVKAFGWKEPIGMTVYNGLGYNGKIIGVVKDFHYASLHEPIQPLVIMPQTRVSGYLLLKLKPENVAQTVAFIEENWKKVSRRYPMEYFFLDDNFDHLYRAEEKMMMIFTYFSILTIIIACLGLLGLVIFNLELRVKEIGVRKVMGASLGQIFWSISKDYAWLILLSVLVAVPASWYFMNNWLNDFAERVSIQWWMFVLSASVTSLVALLTISYQTIKAASGDPVKSLRYE